MSDPITEVKDIIMLSKVWSFLNKITDEINEEDFGDGYLLKYEGWSAACVEHAKTEKEAVEYAESQSDKIIDEWKDDMKRKGYVIVNSGYYPGGLYGRTWALFRKMSLEVSSVKRRRGDMR